MIERYSDSDNSFDKYDEPRLHMERLLKTKLIVFDISMRILIPLENAGITTLGDLTKQTRRKLRGIKQLGSVAIGVLTDLLARNNLSLADD